MKKFPTFQRIKLLTVAMSTIWTNIQNIFLVCLLSSSVINFVGKISFCHARFLCNKVKVVTLTNTIYLQPIFDIKCNWETKERRELDGLHAFSI